MSQIETSIFHCSCTTMCYFKATRLIREADDSNFRPRQPSLDVTTLRLSAMCLLLQNISWKKVHLREKPTSKLTKLPQILIISLLLGTWYF